MRKIMSKTACALAALLLCAGAKMTARPQTRGGAQTTADLKIRQRMTAGGGQAALESVVLIKGARMRSETAAPGAGTATITQCDMKRAVTLNDRARTYMVSPFGAAPGIAPGGAAGPAPPAPRRGGVVNVTRTLTDTGERKELLGHTARRIKMSVLTEAGPNSCNPGTTRVESDGWYIDLDFNFSCGVEQATRATPASPDCDDEVRTRTVGTAKLGYPAQVATTVFGRNGEATVMSQEVLEISRAPLDASLFDVPPATRSHATRRSCSARPARRRGAPTGTTAYAATPRLLPRRACPGWPRRRRAAAGCSARPSGTSRARPSDTSPAGAARERRQSAPPPSPASTRRPMSPRR